MSPLFSLVLLSTLSSALSQTFQYEISGPRQVCLAEEKIRRGDRLTVQADGFLGDGSKFYDNTEITFILGDRSSGVPRGWERGLTKDICPGDKVVMILDTDQLRFDAASRPAGVPADETLYTIVRVTDAVRIPKSLRTGSVNSVAGLQVDVSNSKGCVEQDQVRLGDRLVVITKGFLQDGTVVADATVDFVLGSDSSVLKGWEEGLVGKCAGETVEMIIPPELGYGSRRQGNVPGGSTIISVVTINAVIRVVKPVRGCNEGLKAQPNLDITMELLGKVQKSGQASSRGKLFIDRQLEVRYGARDVKGLQKGLEVGLTGACTDETRLLLLGPALAYGSKGNKAFQQRRGRAVPPEAVVRVEATILRVRNKKPQGDLDIQFLNQLASGTARLPSGRK